MKAGGPLPEIVNHRCQWLGHVEPELEQKNLFKQTVRWCERFRYGKGHDGLRPSAGLADLGIELDADGFHEGGLGRTGAASAGGIHGITNVP